MAAAAIRCVTEGSGEQAYALLKAEQDAQGGVAAGVTWAEVISHAITELLEASENTNAGWLITGDVDPFVGGNQQGTSAGFQGALGSTWGDQAALNPQSTTGADGVIFDRREPTLPGAPSQAPMFSGTELYAAPQATAHPKATPRTQSEPLTPTPTYYSSPVTDPGTATKASFGGYLKPALARKKFHIVFLSLLAILFIVSRMAAMDFPWQSAPSVEAPETDAPVPPTVEDLQESIAEFGEPGNLSYWGGFNSFDYQHWTNGSNAQIGSAENPFAVTSVLGLDGVQQVVSNEFNAYALMDNGTVTAWGSSSSGGRGGVTTDYLNELNQIVGLTDVIQIETSFLSAVAVLDDGTVWTWGANERGNLGDGSKVDYSHVPVQVAGLSDVQTVVAGPETGYAVLTDGAVWGWGSNAFNLLGAGGTPAIPEPVQLPGTTT